MDRRHLLLLLLGLVAAPHSAHADDGEDDDGQDSGDDGIDSGGGDDTGEDGGGEDDGNGGSDTRDQDSALKAVESDGALTLEEFLPHFRRQVTGRVVDVSLSGNGGRLVFVVTFVDPDGRVRRARFDARTGKLMET